MLTFAADLIDRIEQVELHQPNGTYGSYHIKIDNYHHGQIVYTPQGWRAYMGRGSHLMKDDMDALVERVEMYEAGE